MRSTRRFFTSFAFVCLACFASAQPTPRQQPTDSKPIPGAEHYEGTAVTHDQQEIPVTIDLAETAGALSGNITSSYGTFAITGGAHSGDSITVEFDVNGDTGTLSGKLTDGHLVGTFSAGGQSGSVDVRKTTASAVPPPPTPILILGVYHMDNPGLDEVNVQADDVLSAKRQQQMEELVGSLARFRPTKIAIEAPYGETYWPDEYKKYLAGQRKQGRSEIEQIAFRLARRLNLDTLYPIDFPMMANGDVPTEAQIADARKAAQVPKTADALSPEERLLRQSTVSEYLAHLNSDAEIRRGQAAYMMSLLPIGGPEIYRKADLVANWYKRNLRIFANINRVNEPGKDRILVIIGAGHLKLLRDFAADAPYFDLADAGSFLN